MNITLITGSPHKNGTSSLLADRFIKGAEEEGHLVHRFDAAFKTVHPCIACEKCHNTDGGCTFKDSMEELNPMLLVADVVVFVTPIYYFAMSAQIKGVIDRFYANDELLHDKKKTILITTMADDVVESAEGANLCFRGMSEYLGWEVAGILNGVGVSDVPALMETDYPQMAYEMGKNIARRDYR